VEIGNSNYYFGVSKLIFQFRKLLIESSNANFNFEYYYLNLKINIPILKFFIYLQKNSKNSYLNSELLFWKLKFIF